MHLPSRDPGLERHPADAGYRGLEGPTLGYAAMQPRRVEETGQHPRGRASFLSPGAAVFDVLSREPNVAVYDQVDPWRIDALPRTARLTNALSPSAHCLHIEGLQRRLDVLAYGLFRL